MKNNKIKIEVIRGVEGNCLVINNYRVVGPKAWGGGSIIKTWMISREDLMQAFDSAINMPDFEEK